LLFVYYDIVSHDMAILRKKEFTSLLAGDLIVFVLSLWLTLVIRFLSIPTNDTFISHFTPFSLLFVVWALVFFIGGLYDRHTLLLKSKLPQRILSTHIFNLVIASIFFYTVPYFGVTPKVTLFLYLFVSTVLIFVWRFVLFPKMAAGVITKIVVVGEGKDINDLQEKLRMSNNSLISICRVIDPKTLDEINAKKIIQSVLKEEKSHVVAIDLSNPSVQMRMNSLYELIFEGIQFVDVQEVYEDVMDKVPLGLINETWFLEHVSMEPNVIYNTLKRIMDICISLPLMIIPLITYPIVWIAIKIEDGGPFFYKAERIGERGERIKMSKIRSMSVMDEGNQLGQHANKITKVGKLVRVSRLDEFAQLWSVLKGDLSLIGPRPEFPKLVELYIKEIPHYNVRHLIKPGLSGWAQIHHEKPPHSVEETVDKLSYDLYYIKHRSFMLDIKIALQTVKTLLSRVGV